MTVRQRLQSLLDAGNDNVIVNLKEVAGHRFHGLGTLVYCALRFRESGGKLVC